MRFNRLPRLALACVLALAVLIAPGAGAGHVPVASAVAGMQMTGKTHGHDCADIMSAPGAEAGVSGAHAPAADEQASHGDRQSGCAEMCRMVCHVMMILPVQPAISGPPASVHEAGLLPILETLECDVQVPPPRQGA